MSTFDFSKYGISPRWDKTTATGQKLNRSDNLELLYQNVVGRHPDDKGKAYWDKQVQTKGDSAYQDLVNSLQASTEFQNREKAIKANPNITEKELDMLPSAYVSPMSPFSGGSWAGYKPGDKITTEMANQMSGNSGTTEKYTDSFKSMADAYKNFGTTETKTVDGGTQNTTATTSTNSGGLTMDDLNSWWGGLDKPWLKQQESQTNKFDQFMEFMKAMQGMGGMFGQTSYPNMGYGGYAPGGVAAANPYKNMMSFMNAFKSSNQANTEKTTSNLLNQS
tara:strand:- start:916 stop:1749 length:834 start_codon:yes stop_codon:yes gene_type:complete